MDMIDRRDVFSTMKTYVLKDDTNITSYLNKPIVDINGSPIGIISQANEVDKYIELVVTIWNKNLHLIKYDNGEICDMSIF